MQIEHNKFEREFLYIVSQPVTHNKMLNPIGDHTKEYVRQFDLNRDGFTDWNHSGQETCCTCYQKTRKSLELVVDVVAVDCETCMS